MEVRERAGVAVAKFAQPFFAAPPLARHVALFGLAALGGLVAVSTPTSGLPQGLLVLYPLVAFIATAVGLRGALSVGLGVMLGFVLAGEAVSAEFAVTILAVAVLSGAVSDRLSSARFAEEERRVATTSFAAALHLRLMLAEQEIERLRQEKEGSME